MKYMLLAYTGQSDWSAVDVTSAEFLAMCEFYENLGRELTESGELVLTEGLADPSLTRTVRKQEGGPVATDGPYAEAKEVLVSAHAGGPADGAGSRGRRRTYLVPEPTMAQRISRAKQRVKASGVPFRVPPPAELPGRVGVVCQVLYLISNEGY